jgi:uncharacterized protein (DUF927 family)
MRHLKEYKIFESEGDLFPVTKEDIDEIETLFLDIADEFDLESDEQLEYVWHPNNILRDVYSGSYKIYVNGGVLYVLFGVHSSKDIKKLLTMIKSFMDMIKTYYPETFVELRVNTRRFFGVLFDIDQIYKAINSQGFKNNQFRIEIL